MARSALAETGRGTGFGAGEFPIAKRIYIGIGTDPGRARERVNAGLAGIYGRRVPAIEEAAVAGTVTECAAAAREVAAAGAELILFTPLYDVPGHMERIAAEIIPRLDA